MGKSNLITQQLIGAVDFYESMKDNTYRIKKPGFEPFFGMTWAEYAWMSLENLVNRKWTDEMPIAAKRGISFERQVYKQATIQDKKGSELFNNVVDHVRGYSFHNKGGVKVDILGVEEPCYVYTKEDALKLPCIIDIKTTANYEPGKYLKTWQHKLYCYRWIIGLRNVDTFIYIIAEWDNYPTIKTVNTEVLSIVKPDVEKECRNDENKQHHVTTEVEIVNQVEDKIRSTLEKLKQLYLWEAYREKFCLY